jgi:hypothetical protein
MSYPKAYEPQSGYMYQILMKNPGERAFESLDYAVDRSDKNYLLNEYGLAYRGMGIELKTIQLPEKYWPKN